MGRGTKCLRRWNEGVGGSTVGWEGVVAEMGVGVIWEDPESVAGCVVGLYQAVSLC
jgi:hypothetical protein